MPIAYSLIIVHILSPFFVIALPRKSVKPIYSTIKLIKIFLPILMPVLGGMLDSNLGLSWQRFSSAPLRKMVIRKQQIHAGKPNGGTPTFQKNPKVKYLYFPYQFKQNFDDFFWYSILSHHCQWFGKKNPIAVFPHNFMFATV